MLISSLRAELSLESYDRSMGDLDSLNSRIEELKIELESSVNAVEEARKHSQSLTLAHESASASLTSQIAAITADLESTLRAKEEQHALVNQSEELVQSLRAQIESASLESATIKREVDEQRGQNVLAMQTLESTASSLQSQVAALETELASSRHHSEGLMESMKLENATLQGQIDELNITARGLNTMRDLADMKRSAIEGELGALQSKILLEQ